MPPSSILYITKRSTLFEASCSFTPARTSYSFSSLRWLSSRCAAGMTARLSPAVQTQQRQSRTRQLAVSPQEGWKQIGRIKTRQGKHRAQDSYDSIKPDVVKSNVGKKKVFSLLSKGTWRVVPTAPQDLGSWSYSLSLSNCCFSHAVCLFIRLGSGEEFRSGKDKPLMAFLQGSIRRWLSLPAPGICLSSFYSGMKRNSWALLPYAREADGAWIQ